MWNFEFCLVTDDRECPKNSYYVCVSVFFYIFWGEFYTVTQHGGTQHGRIQHGVTQHGVTQHGATQHGVTQHGVTQHGVTQHGVNQHGVTQYGVHSESEATLCHKFVRSRNNSTKMTFWLG
jgi:hypothetical protein